MDHPLRSDETLRRNRSHEGASAPETIIFLAYTFSSLTSFGKVHSIFLPVIRRRGNSNLAILLSTYVTMITFHLKLRLSDLPETQFHPDLTATFTSSITIPVHLPTRRRFPLPTPPDSPPIPPPCHPLPPRCSPPLPSRNASGINQKFNGTRFADVSALPYPYGKIPTPILL